MDPQHMSPLIIKNYLTATKYKLYMVYLATIIPGNKKNSGERTFASVYTL